MHICKGRYESMGTVLLNLAVKWNVIYLIWEDVLQSLIVALYQDKVPDLND